MFSTCVFFFLLSVTILHADSSLFLTTEFIVFLLLAVLIEHIYIPNKKVTLSLNFALVFAALMIIGFYPAMWISILSITFYKLIFANFEITRAIFNGAMFGTMAYIAGSTYIAFGGSTGSLVLLELVPVIAYILVSILVNHIIATWYICGVIKKADYTLTDVLYNFGWDLLTYVVSLPIGLLMVFLYSHIDILGIIIMVITLAVNSYIFRLYKKLELFHKELHSLQKTSINLIESMELDDVLKSITESCETLFETKRCAIWMYQNERLELTLIDGSSPEKNHFLNEGEGIVGKAVQSKSPILVENIFSQEWQEDSLIEGVYQEQPSAIAVPLTFYNQVIGAISLSRDGISDTLEREELSQLIDIFSAQAASALSNALHHQQIENQAITDEKTNLYNYRSFYSQLDDKMKKHPEQPLTILMIDIDDFKQYNDRFGHPAGDKVLAQVANLLKENIRENDIAARYGGEEFTIILCGTRGVEAEKVAERIRSAIANYPFPGDQKTPRVKLTVSIGVGEYPKDGDNAIDIIRKADQALYLGSKERGKNRFSKFIKTTSYDNIVDFPKGVDNNDSGRGCD
ncbi:hypothetical protein CDO51_00425 [Natranaerobius trueperi]|uniref:GGDEF domain-containing protein n=1 Tax=Natranaerobius trueperi TaxID=759412 RepID=A0A226C135_9FIRM|nr:hypothetical protein CDO51_00425 [Natranaerobius trueperi]